MNEMEERMKKAREHWLAACRFSRDAQEEYAMAIREKKHPAVIASLRDRMIAWKGIEDGATGMLRVLEGVDPEAASK